MKLILLFDIEIELKDIDDISSGPPILLLINILITLRVYL